MKFKDPNGRHCSSILHQRIAGHKGTQETIIETRPDIFSRGKLNSGKQYLMAIGADAKLVRHKWRRLRHPTAPFVELQNKRRAVFGFFLPKGATWPPPQERMHPSWSKSM